MRKPIACQQIRKRGGIHGDRAALGRHGVLHLLQQCIGGFAAPFVHERGSDQSRRKGTAFQLLAMATHASLCVGDEAGRYIAADGGVVGEQCLRRDQTVHQHRGYQDEP